MKARRPTIYSKSKIIDVYESGMSIDQVCKEIGCSKTTAYKALKGYSSLKRRANKRSQSNLRR
ncbi:helix-turn-helix domain-containing protein [Bdellovibrio sp. BCCA]|uniref:helix-turn-helix domain-containing protein n=1 Tax=Bdellovibrio sp. BCCA TaxID=3136281 RepID=UPI0040402629